jgi:hypothetical protein
MGGGPVASWSRKVSIDAPKREFQGLIVSLRLLVKSPEASMVCLTSRRIIGTLLGFPMGIPSTIEAAECNQSFS